MPACPAPQSQHHGGLGSLGHGVEGAGGSVLLPKFFPRAASFLSAALSLLLPRPLPPLVAEPTLWSLHSVVTGGRFSSEEQFQPNSPPAQDSPRLPWWWLSSGSRGCGHIKVHAKGCHLLRGGATGVGCMEDVTSWWRLWQEWSRGPGPLPITSPPSGLHSPPVFSLAHSSPQGLKIRAQRLASQIHIRGLCS